MAAYHLKLLELTGLDVKVLPMLERTSGKSVETLKELLELVEDETAPF